MSDLIPVRPEEGFDRDRLQRWIDNQEHLPEGSFKVLQFGGGKANLTYLLTFADGAELVMRRPPLGPLAESSHDMSREYRVLSRLWRAFDKAPRAHALCEDESVIGGPFLLMDRRPGVVVRQVVPEVFGSGRDEQANRQLSEVVIDTLAEFHAVDPERCELGSLGGPEGFLQRQVVGWRGRWELAKHEGNATADEVAGWLEDHLPASGNPTLLHNDWRLDNMAISEDNPGRCVAVYDWDMATRGDPLADLGTLLGTWFDRDEAPEALSMMPTTIPGWMSRDDAIERYAHVSQRDLDHVGWYVVFGTWKLGVILQQIYIRWLRGQTKDPRFESLGLGAALLFNLAAERRNMS